MKTNRWIELSQRFYRQLLHLYPQTYRATYEMEMFRVFTDQCRDAYKQRGKFGILSLWPCILIDVGITATLEHITDPRAKLGLLEVKPDAPLPWKGVLLVLIPGLVFFISQVAQVTSSKDWFFLVFYRAGYFLILPVLLAWLLTRRFPIWGVIPVGLLYETLWVYGQRVQLSNLPLLGHLFTDNTLFRFDKFMIAIDEKYLLLTPACVLLACTFIWYNSRHRQMSRTAWGWLGLYGLLIVSQIGAEAYRLIAWQGTDWSTALSSTDVKTALVQMALWSLYNSLPFLLLVFIGIFFARKYGGLSFLLLLGYLLPTVIFGRYGEWNDTLPFYLVSTAVLVYRFVVALVAPVWLVRAASAPKRQRAAAIPVAVAIICQISLNVIVYLAWASQYGSQTSLLDLAATIWNQLIIAAGLGLAVALYLPRDQATITPPAPAVVT